MLRIKNILNDIVDVAYKGSDKLEKYKKFYVEVSDKTLKSKHGDYNGKDKHIRIFNVQRDDTAIIVTTIHELAHHIDWVNRGFSDHSEAFYEVYRTLLFTALDMKLFNKYKFESTMKDASDSNKVSKIIKTYTPKDAEYKKETTLFVVKGGYRFKEQLKNRKYMFNAINGTWEKEVSKADRNDEIAFMKWYDIEYSEKAATAITFNKKEYIVAGKGSFERREELKQDGFQYDKKRGWKKPYTKEDLVACKTKYPEVDIYILQ